MDALIELKARIRWTLARIGEIVNAGRDDGWLTGRQLDVADSDGCLEVLASHSGVTPMRLLASRLKLRAVEVDMLWLLACVELDPHVAHAAQVLVFAGMHELSAQMVERLVARAGSLEPAIFERLHQLGLIETTFDSRVPLYRRPVRVHDRVLDAARGEIDLDRSLRKFAMLETEIDVRRKTLGIITAIPAELRAAASAEEPRLVVVMGPDGSGRRTMTLRAIAGTGRSAITVDADLLAREEMPLLAQLRAIARECRIHDALPILRVFDDVPGLGTPVERELVATLGRPVFVTAREAIECATSIALTGIRAPHLDTAERGAIWRRALPAANSSVIDECAHKYSVTPGLIHRAARTVSAVEGGIDLVHVQAGLRAHLDRELSASARRIETTQSWDDLVLPIDQFDLLIELVARVRRRDQVMQEWGFANKVGRGTGTAALMSGPPGTGKTMIAGLIARELGLDLYQVDLSKIVSKYIGETEKQLAKLFDAAESGQAILLFDEADSVFAKRTEVKGSNDRYANLQVNYLLQRMESFSGITLLTTNHETSIDPAFLRRLAFHIRIPLPEEREREHIWTAMLPSAAPISADLDVRQLAQRFAMSGGYIRNAVLRAAFMAAEEGSEIATRHLESAAKLEYEGMGKIAA